MNFGTLNILPYPDLGFVLSILENPGLGLPHMRFVFKQMNFVFNLDYETTRWAYEMDLSSDTSIPEEPGLRLYKSFLKRNELCHQNIFKR